MRTGTPVRMPEASDVRALLGELLDRPVRCTEAVDPPEADTTLVAIYHDDRRLARAAWLVELGLAVAASAALVKMPPSAVTDALAQGAVPPSLVDVFHEVANIGSTLVNAAGAEHLVLRHVTIVEQFREDEHRVLDSLRFFVLDVDVADYGRGTCAFYCA
jgi:hypothetical protein